MPCAGGVTRLESEMQKVVRRCMWVGTRVQRRRVECCAYICRWVEIADACTQPGVSRPALPNEQLGLEVGGEREGGRLQWA